jgi:hypothetical protein
MLVAGQLQVQVDGQVIMEATAAEEVIIPLPGKLLKISCNSFRIPVSFGGFGGIGGLLNSSVKFSSKRFKGTTGFEGADVVIDVAEKSVGGVGDGGSLVVDSKIFDMYRMYHSSMLLMLFDKVVAFAVVGLAAVVVVVVVVVIRSSPFPGNKGLLARTESKKDV